MSDPIRELEIAEAQLASLQTQLATMAELNNSQREILHKVAVERDAAVSALALATGSTPGKGTGVWMTLTAYMDLLAQIAELEERVKAQMVQLSAVTADRDAQLALVERFGADQWRNGNAGRDPQEFEEWRREQP